MWLRDTGIMNKMKDGILGPTIPTHYPKAKDKQPLSIRQLGIVLIVLLSGIILSIIVFIFELLKNSRKKGNLPPGESIDLRNGNAMNENSRYELIPSNQQQSDSGIALHRAQGRTTFNYHK